MSFSYCKNLTTVVLPKSVSRIMDKAFYESNSLKTVVFIGDEPSDIGEDVFCGTSGEFKIMYYLDTKWDDSSHMLEQYSSEQIVGDNLILLNDVPVLKNDSYYSMEHSYCGDDIPVTLVTRNPGETSVCVLGVYPENNKSDSIQSEGVTTTQYMNNILFEDVNVQYAGEIYCTLKAFWWDKESAMKPLARNAELIMEKPNLDE